MSYLDKWKSFVGKTERKLLFEQKRKKYLQEVSEKEAGKIWDWFDNDFSKLSFSDLFDGNLRVAFPLTTEEEKQLDKVTRLLHDAGYNPAGDRGAPGVFPVKKVKQKQRRLGGEEFEEEVWVPDLKVAKQIEKVIPKGPRAGETVTQKREVSIAKALASKDVGAPKELVDWWNKNQAKYTKDKNWEQIETSYRTLNFGHGRPNPHGYTVIASRHPVDVLRMSDFENIQSCHSEGQSYFKCAVAEARGHGPIAYLVKDEDFHNLLNPVGEWGIDYDEVAGQDPPEPHGLSEFDNNEIFADPDRRVKGLQPVSRVRLRRFEDTDNGEEFAAPELRVYGKSVPGFQQAVSRWAWTEQKEIFYDADGDMQTPEEYSLMRHGGSYEDNDDGTVLNSFFAKSGEQVIDQYSGNVAHDTEEEDESVYDEWSNQIDEINQQANALEHVGFYAGVEEGDEHPYVMSSARLTITVPLTGWDGASDEGGWTYPMKDVGDKLGGEMQKISELEPIPDSGNWSDMRDFIGDIEPDDFYPEDTEYDITLNPPEIEITYRISCDDCGDPNDVEGFLDYVRTDIDENYKQITEKVRQALIAGDYIAAAPFDTAAKELEDKKFKNFEFMEDLDNEGEVWLYSKNEKGGILWPLDIKIPKIFAKQFKHEGSGTQFYWDNLTLFKTLQPLMRNRKTGPGGGYLHLDPAAETAVADQLIRLEQAAGEIAKKQLHLDLGDDWEPKIFSSDDIAATMIMGVGYIGDQGGLGAYFRAHIDIDHTEAEIKTAIKFVELLDQNISTIKKAFENVIEPVILAAVKEKTEELFRFESGETIKGYVDVLTEPQYPEDYRRLGMWVWQNWKEFDKVEKRVAEKILKDVFGGADWVLNPPTLEGAEAETAPPGWNSKVQLNGGPIHYKWTGPSIWDIEVPGEEKEEPKEEPAEDVEKSALVTESKSRRKMVIRIKTS
jgi:hypothetical protein